MGMAAARFAQVQHWLSRGRVIAFVSHEVCYYNATSLLGILLCLVLEADVGLCYLVLL